MSDSEIFVELERKHARNQQERFEAVTRWVSYMRDNPATVWGPQQNAVVNGQLESAQATQLSAEHEQRIRSFAADLAADEPDT